jgi:hypothetical protein
MLCRAYPIQMLERATLQVAPVSGSLQLWLILHEDSSLDTLYYHSANPHTEFPFRFAGVDWTVSTPPWLMPFIDDSRFECGVWTGRDEIRYFVRPRQVTAQ